MENKMTLFDLSAQMAQIEDQLYENGGELTPELEKEMTETQESLMEKVDGYNALYQKMGAMAADCKAEIDRLTKIKKTAENAQKRLKERLLFNMHAFGLQKLEGRLCKMSIMKSKSLNVDEGLMLKDFQKEIDGLNRLLPSWCTVKVDISKTAIKEAFKGTDLLPKGCEYVTNESLQIR